MSSDSAQTPVVWITGAAGGLGSELTQRFAAAGWRVAATGHSTSPVTTSGQIFAGRVDVTDPDQVQKAVADILSRWGRIDVLINNAGVAIDQPIWQLTPADWDRVLSVNLKGAFLCARAVLRPMMRQREGHILNISSHAGRSGRAGQSNYAAAKAGLLGLTQSLAREVGSRNIRVNAVLPGLLPTAMTERLPRSKRDELVSANVLGRLNSLEEVARFIVFLANLQNVSGQLFQLDSRIARWT